MHSTFEVVHQITEVIAHSHVVGIANDALIPGMDLHEVVTLRD